MTIDQHARIARQITELDGLTVIQLQEKWENVWNEPCRSQNKNHLKKRIAWRIQTLAHGGLSLRALERAHELVDETLLRRNAPARPAAQPASCGETTVHSFAPAAQSDRLMPGAVLTRDYKGRKLLVTVLEKGFEFEAKVYRSLTAVAKEATGSHWNGRQFFGLVNTGKEAA